VRLADHLVQRAGSHSGRERRVGFDALVGGLVEQGHPLSVGSGSDERIAHRELGDELTERLVFFALAPLQRAQDVVVEIESGARASDAHTTRI